MRDGRYSHTGTPEFIEYLQIDCFIKRMSQRDAVVLLLDCGDELSRLRRTLASADAARNETLIAKMLLVVEHALEVRY